MHVRATSRPPDNNTETYLIVHVVTGRSREKAKSPGIPRGGEGPERAATRGATGMPAARTHSAARPEHHQRGGMGGEFKVRHRLRFCRRLCRRLCRAVSLCRNLYRNLRRVLSQSQWRLVPGWALPLNGCVGLILCCTVQT